ncbi:MAG: peptidylprolyl isomerase [Chloroflexota bacterium]
MAMAKTSQPNSANSQFFIVLADLPTLPKSYQIFGHVTSGMETVDAIAAMPNSGEPNNQALQPVPMDSVTVSNLQAFPHRRAIRATTHAPQRRAA